MGIHNRHESKGFSIKYYIRSASVPHFKRISLDLWAASILGSIHLRRFSQSIQTSSTLGSIGLLSILSHRLNFLILTYLPLPRNDPLSCSWTSSIADFAPFTLVEFVPSSTRKAITAYPLSFVLLFCFVSFGDVILLFTCHLPSRARLCSAALHSTSPNLFIISVTYIKDGFFQDCKVCAIYIARRIQEDRQGESGEAEGSSYEHLVETR